MPKLSPSEYNRLRLQNKVGVSNFDQYFTRQGGNIYSKDQAPAQPAQPQAPDYRAMYGLPGLEQKATQAKTDYTNTAGGQQAFLDALKKALLGQDTQTQGLQTEQQRLQKEQYTQPTSERERLIAAGIDDPFERQRRISEALGTTDSALSAVSSRLAGLGKTREDLVQQGVKGYEADLATKDESRKAAADALKEAMGLITKAQQADIAKKEKKMEAEAKRKEKIQDEALAYKRKLDFESFKAGLKPKKGTGGKIINTKTIKPPTLDKIYSENTTQFKNFIKSIQETAGMNIDPNKANDLYNDFQEAQQAIDQDPARLDEVMKNPNAQLFKHLLKVPKTSTKSPTGSPPPIFGVPKTKE